MSVPKLLQAFDVRFSESEKRWKKTEVVLEWKHVICLRHIGPYWLDLMEPEDTGEENQIRGVRKPYEVTEVLLVNGPVVTLLHPFKELLPAFRASRGEA